MAFFTNTENVFAQPAFRRRSSKRSFGSICDENGSALTDVIAPRFSEPSPKRASKASARRSRGLSDITNGVTDLCLDLKLSETSWGVARRVSDVDMGGEVPTHRQQPVLPAALIAEIFAFAGFVHETEEAEYAGTLLVRERQREPRFLAMLGWRAAADMRDRMRATVVDWLQEVHRNAAMKPRSLFLAVNLLDRFMERREVRVEGIQLAAAAALQLASKVDEVKSLRVRTLAWLCADAYSPADFRACEQSMLATLNFQVESPTLAEFLPVYLSACQAEANLGSLELSDGDVARNALRFGALSSAQDRLRNETVSELASLSLLDAELCRRHPPSLLAAALVLASNKLLGSRRPWPGCLEHLSGYSEAALSYCVDSILALRHPDTAPEYCREFIRQSTMI